MYVETIEVYVPNCKIYNGKMSSYNTHYQGLWLVNFGTVYPDLLITYINIYIRLSVK